MCKTAIDKLLPIPSCFTKEIGPVPIREFWRPGTDMRRYRVLNTQDCVTRFICILSRTYLLSWEAVYNKVAQFLVLHMAMGLPNQLTQ